MRYLKGGVKMKIKFRDLSWVLKIAAIAMICDAVFYAYYFIEGFITAL